MVIIIHTGAAGVFSLSFIFTAAAGLIAQILEVYLDLFTVLLHCCLCCRDTEEEEEALFHYV